MNWIGNYRKKRHYYMGLVGYEIHMQIVFCCCIVLFLISYLFSISYAIETPITRQSIEDAPFDWIDIDKRTAAVKGDSATDIVEVTYFTKDGSCCRFIPYNI